MSVGWHGEPHAVFRWQAVLWTAKADPLSPASQESLPIALWGRMTEMPWGRQLLQCSRNSSVPIKYIFSMLVAMKLNENIGGCATLILFASLTGLRRLFLPGRWGKAATPLYASVPACCCTWEQKDYWPHHSAFQKSDLHFYMNFRQPVIYIKQVLERSTLTLGTRKAGKADLSLTEWSEFLKFLEGYDLLSEATNSGLITACWILKLALLLKMQMRSLDLGSWGKPTNLDSFQAVPF